MTDYVFDNPDVKLAQQWLRLTQFSVDHAADAIFWVRPDGRFIYVNEQAVCSLGYSHEELLTLSVADLDPLFPKNDTQEWDKSWEKLREQGFQAFETVHRRKDGSEMPVWVHASYYNDGETELSFACCRDLSEKRAVEQALRRANDGLEMRVMQRTAELVASEARYQDLYHNAPDMFASIDADTGRFVQCNRTMAESTGHQTDELVGRHLAELYTPECRAEAQRVWESFMATGEVRGRELALLCQDGEKIEVSVNMSAIRGPHGRILRSRSTFRDITDFRRAEEQVERHRSELAHVARLATTGEMAAGLAHELNQPLYAMHNFAQGALRRLETGSLDHDSLLGVLHDIARESQRAAEIIRSLRRYVGKREQQRVLVDVNESVRAVVRLLAAEAHRRQAAIHVQLAERLPPVRCDAIQIEQVLMNLILNGMESMIDLPPEERRICVRTEHTGPEKVRLAVSDQGAGLPLGEANRVYDAFFTTKPDGIGLGLTISRTIVESHGGRLIVTPNPERGVKFSFELPVFQGDLTP